MYMNKYYMRLENVFPGRSKTTSALATLNSYLGWRSFMETVPWSKWWVHGSSQQYMIEVTFSE